MQMDELAQYLNRLEVESSRLKITEILADLYQHLQTDELAIASYLLLGGLRPQYRSLEFQLSVKSVLKTLGTIVTENREAFGGETGFQLIDDNLVLSHYKNGGDVGSTTAWVLETVEHSRCSQQSSNQSDLELSQTYQLLECIALESGTGSQERKQQQLQTLFLRVSPLSGKYIARIVLGKLRLGFSTQTLLDAFSWVVHENKSDSKLLEEAYQKQADIGALAERYLGGSKEAATERLAQIDVTIGVPVVPALCQRLNSATEIIEKMGTVFVEPKYDGLRVQLHYDAKNGRITAYSRSLEDITHMFPELIDLPKQLNCKSCILDGEAIGYDPQTDQLRAFQDTITRKRKHEVAGAASDVPIRFYIFDVLLLDKVPILQKKMRERKDLLINVIIENDHIKVTPSTLTNDPNQVRIIHVDSLAQGLEGAVVKQPDGIYQSGRKGWSWVKIKETEGTRGKLSDTIDAVVMGYYRGRGKRATFGVGAFLVGVWGPDSEGKILTVAKIGTGLSDEQFREFKHRAGELETSTSSPFYKVPSDLIPDVWIAPGLIVEIAADEVTRSPLHTAGVALRFPRLVRFREDKTLEEVTRADELPGMHLGEKDPSQPSLF